MASQANVDQIDLLGQVRNDGVLLHLMVRLIVLLANGVDKVMVWLEGCANEALQLLWDGVQKLREFP